MLSYFQDKILDTTLLILYRKLYINIVSIMVLNIEARQYNIKINLVGRGAPHTSVALSLYLAYRGRGTLACWGPAGTDLSSRDSGRRRSFSRAKVPSQSLSAGVKAPLS